MMPGGNLHRGVLSLNVLYCFGKLLCKAGTLDWGNSQVMAVLGAFHLQPAQNHFRMLHKIAVEGKTILGLPRLHPCRFDVRRAVTFLQEDNVADDFRSCICLKSVIG